MNTFVFIVVRSDYKQGLGSQTGFKSSCITYKLWLGASCLVTLMSFPTYKMGINENGS